tara:strand:+ start:182 stop:421 length:240 start_codon:yes stop_codon:yes gene_type:complete
MIKMAHLETDNIYRNFVMRYILSIAISIAALSFNSAHAYSGANGNQGRTLGPEVQCMIKNGDIVSMPVKYCKLLEGKEM